MIITRDMERDAAAYVRWEERAAIIEHDGGLSRADAERAATRELQFTPRPRTVPILSTLAQRINDDAVVASNPIP